MKIAICDERKQDREVLKKLLEDYEIENWQDFEILEYDSELQLYEDKESLQLCQIIFLDISKDEIGELQAAMKVRELYPNISIVLVSACMNSVLDGYKVGASRFLLKDELPETIIECMNTILKKRMRNDLVVQFSFVEGNVALLTKEIIYIETNRHKNIFHTHKGTYSLYRKLSEIEKELSGMGFVRIHQSFLVNMRYIEKISSYIMRLTTGIELSVPKSRYPGVKRQYALYKEEQ